MEHGSPAFRVLVGREDHGASSDVAVVDDVIEHVGCIVSVGEVANLVDDEHVRAHVDGECVAELSFTTSRREMVDELGGGGEECVESVLQCAARDGDREMRLAASGLALARAFAREGGNYTGLLRLILALFGAESRSTDGADVASQLRSRGISPRAVFLTHLHGDHTSGLVDLPALVPAVFGRGEDTFMQKAMIGDHLDGRPLYALDFDEAHALPPFERVLDLLGDGSIWAISTPGHSPNHVSYLVNAQSGPVLITGDACAYHAQFEHRIRPSPGVDDQEAAIRSLAGLRELYDQFPQLQVMIGHEPPRRR